MTTVEILAEYFPPNPYRHGRLTRVTRGKDGKLQKSAVTRDGEAVTLSLLEQHLGLARGGPAAIGYQPMTIVDGVDCTNVGMFDFDAKHYGHDPARLMANVNRVLDAATADMRL